MEWLSAIEGIIVFTLGLIGKSLWSWGKNKLDQKEKDTTDDLTLDGLCDDVKELSGKIDKGFASEAAARQKLEDDLQEHKRETVQNQSDLKLMITQGNANLKDFINQNIIKQNEKTSKILNNVQIMLERHDTEISNLKNK